MAQLAMHEEPADHEEAETTPGTLRNPSLTTFESRPLDQLEHLEVPPMRIAVELQIFGLTGAIAPAESVARNAVINVIKDATKAPQAYDIQVQCVGYAAGKIPTWTASAPNLCINVVITSTAPEAVWAKLRCKIMAIDWESVKQANFCTTFRRPRYPKAQWDSGATMHWIGYLGIPCSTFYASQDFFIDTLIELAGEWQATPFIEVYGGQVCLFLKFADLDPLMAAIPTFVSIVDDATGAEFFPTSSYVKGVRTLILGHLANIPDAKRTGASWWKLGVAMSTAAIRALLYQIGVDNAHLPVTACPLINNGLLEACFVSWATPEAANAVYQHCGWDRVQAFTIKGTNARAALFKFPTFIGNQRGYFADRRVLRAAAPAPAAARMHLNRASAPASPAAAGNGAEEGEIVPAAAAAPKRSRPSAEK